MRLWVYLILCFIGFVIVPKGWLIPYLGVCIGLWFVAKDWKFGDWEVSYERKKRHN